jgi:hypothetical protein
LVAHAAPQALQFSASLRVSTHVPEHEVLSSEHVQDPFVHSRSFAHTLEQLPQFDRSLWVSTQELPHCASERSSQYRPQAPFLQDSPAPHARPQPPQLAVSVSKSEHASPQ